MVEDSIDAVNQVFESCFSEIQIAGSLCRLWTILLSKKHSEKRVIPIGDNSSYSSKSKLQYFSKKI